MRFIAFGANRTKPLSKSLQPLLLSHYLPQLTAYQGVFGLFSGMVKSDLIFGNATPFRGRPKNNRLYLPVILPLENAVMKKIVSCIRRFHDETLAVTATEYAVMIAVILIGIIVSLKSLGSEASATFQKGADIMQATAEDPATVDQTN